MEGPGGQEGVTVEAQNVRMRNQNALLWEPLEDPRVGSNGVSAVPEEGAPRAASGGERERGEPGCFHDGVMA